MYSSKLATDKLRV